MASSNERLKDMVAELDRSQRVTTSLLVAANLIFPALMFIAAWPEPWRGFDWEHSPINWLSTVQCMLVAAIAWAAWALAGLGRRAGTEPLPRRWPWLVFALGFMAMAIDERFRGHERIRDEILKPRGWFTEIDYLLPGDVVLIAYVFAGLALSWFLLPELRQLRASLILFSAAIVLIGISAVQDSLDLPLYHTPGFHRFRTITEELAEVWAQLLFALSFLLLLFLKLRRLLRGLAAVDGPAGE